jgi:hypothetical protein
MITDNNIPIVLEPQLDACVETQAKREYHNALSEAMKKEPDRGLAERLETLRLFLKNADFSRLRSESEPLLAEGKRVRFVLRLEGGSPVWKIEVFPGGEDNQR